MTLEKTKAEQGVKEMRGLYLGWGLYILGRLVRGASVHLRAEH